MTKPTEAEKRYFEETALALRREGIQVERLPDGYLEVVLDGQPLCEVRKIGGITYGNVTTSEQMDAKEKVFAIVRTTAEYMRHMEVAPPLVAKDLKEGYKILAEVNDTILAAINTKRGVNFVTWTWDYNHKGLCYGHYFDTNYIGAKQNFAIRSQLISEDSLFSKEQLVEIYRCCADTMEADMDLTYDRKKCIRSVQDQIETSMPDIMDRIQNQTQSVADLFPQEPLL